MWGKRTPGLAPGGEFPHSRKPLCRFCLRRVQASLWRWVLAHIRFTTSTTMSSGFPKVSGVEKTPLEGKPLGRRILRQHRRRTQPRHSTTLHPTRTRPNTTLEPRSLLRGNLLGNHIPFFSIIEEKKKLEFELKSTNIYQGCKMAGPRGPEALMQLYSDSIRVRFYLFLGSLLW